MSRTISKDQHSWHGLCWRFVACARPPRPGSIGRRTVGIVVLEENLRRLCTVCTGRKLTSGTSLKNTGHEFLPEMKGEMIQWFERHRAGQAVTGGTAA